MAKYIIDNNQLHVLKAIDKDHGRLETRQYAISTNLDWLPNKAQWANLNAVVMVDSVHEIKTISPPSVDII